MGLCCCKICDDEEPIIDNRSAVSQSSTRSRPSVPIQRQTFYPTPTTTQAPIVRPPNLQARNESYRVITATIKPQVLAPQVRPHVTPQVRPQVVAPQVVRQPLVKPRSECQPIQGIIESEISKLRPRKNVTRDDNSVLALIKALRTAHHALYVPPNNAYELEELDPNSNRFLRKKLFSHPKFNENYKIELACRIWNPHLMTQYLMNKKKYEETCTERHLFHGTGQNCVAGILTHNFDWRLTKEAWYGKGVYFAKNPFYAALYSMKRQNGSENYVMIVAKVLVEMGEISKGYSHTTVPEEGHTTTSQHGHELIKYEDACFYPEFLVYFQRTRCALTYEEFLLSS